MHRLMLTSIFSLLAVPALAQDGAILQGTPTTFAAPATITHWDPKTVTFEPGAAARIYIELVARGRPDITMSIEYPRDCAMLVGEPGAEVPKCPARDTSAEVNAALGVINGRNYSGANPRLWGFIFTNICADFPERFPGGCTVQ